MRREREITARPHELAEVFRLFSADYEVGPEAGRRVMKAPTLDEIDRGEVEQ